MDWQTLVADTPRTNLYTHSQQHVGAKAKLILEADISVRGNEIEIFLFIYLAVLVYVWREREKERKKRSIHVVHTHEYIYIYRFSLVWFLCLMAYQLFLGYLMPNPFS